MSLLFALRGRQGDAGDKGDEGDKGDAGDKGDKGDKGDTGDPGGTTYIDRGDPSSCDFTAGNFTTNNLWHDLDLSSIIPVNTIAVHLIVTVAINAANVTFNFRKPGNSNAINIAQIRTQVANIRRVMNIIVSCSNDRKIEYSATSGTWSEVNFTVRGWFL